MNLIVDMSLRGSSLAILVLALERALGRRIFATGRRAWWWLLPLPFLIPLRVSLFPLLNGLPGIGNWGGRIAAANPPPYRHTPTMLGPLLPSSLTFVWLAGVIVCLLSIGWRTVIALREWAHEKPSTDPVLRRLLQECQQKLGVTIHVRLVISRFAPTPAILGWYRPRILLPAHLVSAMPPDRLRAVLLHELAHCSSSDMLLNSLFSLVCALHWFNPLAHLAAAGWKRFRETAADETAIRSLGTFTVYGESLLQALQAAPGGCVPYGALAFGESFGDLKRRIRLIGEFGGRTSRPILAITLSVLLALISFVHPAPTQCENELTKCPINRLLEQFVSVPAQPQ